MRTAFSWLFVVALSLPCWGGGSEVGNGGGLAEKNFIFAFTNLNRFIPLCLETPLCHVNTEESELLTKILKALPAEQKNATPLVFRTGKGDVDFFKIDGLIRIAKTGEKVGDPIYINQDLLYTMIAPGEFKAADIPLATSALIHELGHHQGVKDHTKLDTLGTKLQTLLLTDSERSLFWNGNAALTTFNFNHVHSDDDKNRIQVTDELILETGGELYSLTPYIQKTIRCPGPRAAAPVTGIRLYNGHGARGIHFDKQAKVLMKPFEFWYILSCDGGLESDHGDLNLELSFRKRADGKFDFLESLVKVKQVSCKSDPHAC